LDHIRLTSDVMAICGIEDTTFLKAARLISRHGMRVFDAFHAAHCGGTIISSDRVFDRVGLKRVRLERE
jgi:predicted nucleic acid-binding protein